jgi:DNA-binding response OmpR family regulator
MGADMNTRTVLVVEDEPYLSDLLATALSDQGYEVLKARDGLQAIRTLDEQRANQSGPCLVLLDMMLPQVDGMGVLRHITDHGHQEAVVAISASDGHLAAAADAGAYETIPKPFELEQLLAVVDRYCGKPD